jgi:hypothetical protein
MKRGVYLLLVLFSVWLLVTPGQGAPRVRLRPTVSTGVEKTKAVVDQVVQFRALPGVLKAPPLARLPAAPALLPRARFRWLMPSRQVAPDRRAALRKVSTRRKVPRLSAEEPPWCAFDA